MTIATIGAIVIVVLILSAIFFLIEAGFFFEEKMSSTGTLNSKTFNGTDFFLVVRTGNDVYQLCKTDINNYGFLQPGHFVIIMSRIGKFTGNNYGSYAYWSPEFKNSIEELITLNS